MRFAVVSVLLIAIGAVAAIWVSSSRTSTESPAYARRAVPASRAATGGVAGTEERADDDRQRALERQIRLLKAKVADEAIKRQRLEDQVAALTAQLAALAHGSGETASGLNAPDGGPAPDQATVAGEEARGTVSGPAASAMERALIAAGIDATTAADMKRRQDELAMAEIYLRDQATREQWLNTPRFNEELAAIEEQRTSIRDEIGDDAYDRYLFAQGQTNRVRVDDVMSDSVAAQAGLQAGDIVLRYGDTRIFGPQDLVNETRSGRAGESIQLEIIRNGARLAVQVPRGPLGLRIAATQSEPTS